jgi:hypothetical protein
MPRPSRHCQPLRPITPDDVRRSAAVHSRASYRASYRAPAAAAVAEGDGEDMRLAYEQAFIAAGVSVVFSGHVHAYERSYVVDDNIVVEDGAGVVHLNTGDGGASVRVPIRVRRPCMLQPRDGSRL